MKQIKLFLGKKEYTIFLIAIIVFFLFYLPGIFIDEWAAFPLASFQKIAFAAIQVSIIGGCTWIWMNVIPKLKRMIDPDDFDNDDIERLTRWQKTLLAFLFYALYFLGGILSANQF